MFSFWPAIMDRSPAWPAVFVWFILLSNLKPFTFVFTEFHLVTFRPFLKFVKVFCSPFQHDDTFSVWSSSLVTYILTTTRPRKDLSRLSRAWSLLLFWCWTTESCPLNSYPASFHLPHGSFIDHSFPQLPEENDMWDSAKKYYSDEDVMNSLFLSSAQGCSIFIQFYSIAVLTTW